MERERQACPRVTAARPAEEPNAAADRAGVTVLDIQCGSGARPAAERRSVIPHMAARTKGRAKFDFHGRPLLWWVDGDRYLRITSLDKKFVIAYPIGTEPEAPAVVE